MRASSPRSQADAVKPNPRERSSQGSRHRGQRPHQAVRQDRTTALDGLDLAAEYGQVLAVLGPSGARKNMFVRAVATLLRLNGGRLAVAGHDVGREPRAGALGDRPAVSRRRSRRAAGLGLGR
jgi:ABC-type multidrug transport system ATPase subunit